MRSRGPYYVKILHRKDYFVRLLKNCLIDELLEADSSLLKKFLDYKDGSSSKPGKCNQLVN